MVNALIATGRLSTSMFDLLLRPAYLWVRLIVNLFFFSFFFFSLFTAQIFRGSTFWQKCVALAAPIFYTFRRACNITQEPLKLQSFNCACGFIGKSALIKYHQLMTRVSIHENSLFDQLATASSPTPTLKEWKFTLLHLESINTYIDNRLVPTTEGEVSCFISIIQVSCLIIFIIYFFFYRSLKIYWCVIWIWINEPDKMRYRHFVEERNSETLQKQNNNNKLFYYRIEQCEVYGIKNMRLYILW